MNTIHSYFKSKDKIVKPSHQLLHYDKDSQQKTFIGGFVSTFIDLLVMYIAIEQGLRMVTFGAPIIKSQEKAQLDSTSKISINSGSKILFEIWEGEGKEYKKSLNLKGETEKYINVQVNQITKTYKDGVEKVTEKRYPVTLCSNIEAQTDYEKQFIERNKDVNLYCPEDPSIFM